MYEVLRLNLTLTEMTLTIEVIQIAHNITFRAKYVRGQRCSPASLAYPRGPEHNAHNSRRSRVKCLRSWKYADLWLLLFYGFDFF